MSLLITSANVVDAGLLYTATLAFLLEFVGANGTTYTQHCGRSELVGNIVVYRLGL